MIPRLLHLLLVLLGLGVAVVPAASPFFTPDAIPRTNDLAPHLYRVLALLRVWDWTQLWPRWSPDLVHGYGYPVFNFFPALSHMSVALPAQAGLPITTAYRLVVFLHFWLAATGAYWFGRTLFNSVGGWLGALAYVYSPYFLYDVGVRGSLPETQALVFFPFLALALWRAVQGNRRWIVALPLLFAGIFLSHYPVTYQSLLILGLWLLWLAWRWGWRALTGPAIGLAIGVALTAFFWLPALTEIAATQADLSISQGYGIAQNFLWLRELFAVPMLPVDPALLNPPVVRPLPLLALLVASSGLLWSWRWLDPAQRWLVVGWGGLLLIAVWLITPASAFVWDAIPLLDQTLYPWRLLGVISWLALGLVAAGASRLAYGRWGRWLAAGLTALFIIAATPWLFLPQEPFPENPTVADLVVFEAPPYFIGTTTLGEFLPRTIAEMPDTADLRQALAQTGNPDRLLECSQTGQQCAPQDPLDAVYTVNLAQPATFTYRQFYFPGWQVTLDGQPWTLRPSQPHGLIEVDLPAGAHTLRLYWGTTPARQAGALISWLALGVGLPALFLLIAPRLPKPALPSPPSLPSLPKLTPLAWGSAALLAWLLLARVDTPLRLSRLTSAGVWGAPAMTPIDYAGELRLLGVEFPTSLSDASQSISLDTYWQAQRPIGVVYDFGVHLIDAEGVTWNTPDTARPRDWRFIGPNPWSLDGYRLEPFELHLLDGAPPGLYQLQMGLVRRDTGQTVAAHSIGAVRVLRPANGNRPLEEGLQPLTPPPTAGGLSLLGSRLDRREARPGDPVRVALLWQVTGAAQNEFTLRLVAADGGVAWQLIRPIASQYEPAQWRAGDRLRSETVLRFPATLTSGVYHWQAQWADQPPVPVGAVTLTAPERSFTPPPLEIQTNASLGDVAKLLGANVTLAADSLQLRLAWRSLAETAVSYRVFVHLRDAAGQIVAQSDAEPAAWSRPTTGWLPGEVILDDHQITLPPDLPSGSYTLLVGLYDPATAIRLRLPHGDDAISVETVTLP
ncbi:MAG: hypothetical protein Fur0021_33220 [Candidatus Promineifilaceae bacterium]